MIKELIYDNRRIKYSLSFSDRKTLGIKVTPDKSVEVIAPLDARRDQIQEMLKKKASWILKQQSHFESFGPLTPPRQYVSGETHLYLGRQYRLRVREALKEEVQQEQGYIYVLLKDRSDKQRKELLLKSWYKDRAIEIFPSMLQKMLKLSFTFVKKFGELKYRWMNKRWGSCLPNGNIILNPALIKAPKSCIEYVMTHELCHLEHLNHSKAFYALLERYCPKWKEIKHRMEVMLS